MEYHERPGVYSNYALSSVWSSGSSNAGVALAADYTGSGLLTVTSAIQAEQLLGENGKALELCRLALMNGAGQVLVYPVEAHTASGYEAAMKKLLEEKKTRFMICDTDEDEILGGMCRVLTEYAAQGLETIGVAGTAGTEVAALTEKAEKLNSERMVLTAGACTLSWNENATEGVYGAAALAGLLAAQEDPALPVNGVALSGLGQAGHRFSETEIDTLVQGGVTVLESMGGTVSPVRAVTTRTTTSDAPDASWREVTTIMVVDDVIPGVRNALKSRFLRRKNNEATRGAIRSQVAMELENRKKKEIITDYGEIFVEPDENDPTVCVVGFSFGVACGVSRIYLTAHITV